ncbi:MAG: pyridoxine 5'-phosphate synthase [Candidatus Lokiarchaeota archaeon]|nr:pyridoxine 5'-phosphate synthase [Candidatus Lokiarchaeota archaeon]
MIKLIRLSVNIDHVATLREARGGDEPKPILAALECEHLGVEGITFHLRKDRRHIQDYDVYLLKKLMNIDLNFEMATTEEMQKIAVDIKPEQCTLVPETLEERTTQGGLDIIKNKDLLKNFIPPLKESGIKVSIFIDSDETGETLKVAKEVGADRVELHTGPFAEASNKKDREEKFTNLQKSALFADKYGLELNAGHSLNFKNLKKIKILKNLREVSIGHNIWARALFIGLENAIKEIMDVLKEE